MILDLLLWHHWWLNVLRNLSGINFFWKLSLLDSLHFAYQARRGVEDASSTLLNMIMKHLEGRKTHVRLLFVDFSSVFNTIQPHVLVNKLISEFKIEFKLVRWLLDFFKWYNAESKSKQYLFRYPHYVHRFSPRMCSLTLVLHLIY